MVVLRPLSRVHSQSAHDITAKAHLTDLMSTTILDLVISEDGDNVSREERHLARAEVRDVKILVLDDAMAGCDVEMDQLIQSTFPAVFSQCMMLMIAHRLYRAAACLPTVAIDGDLLLCFKIEVLASTSRMLSAS